MLIYSKCLATFRKERKRGKRKNERKRRKNGRKEEREGREGDREVSDPFNILVR